MDRIDQLEPKNIGDTQFTSYTKPINDRTATNISI